METPTTSSVDKARERVSRGAQYLDAQFPGWVGKMNLRRLSTQSEYWCPLAQATGKCYEHALEGLPLTYKDTIEHGFTSEFTRTRDWADLDARWSAEIVSRLITGGPAT